MFGVEPMFSVMGESNYASGGVRRTLVEKFVTKALFFQPPGGIILFTQDDPPLFFLSKKNPGRSSAGFLYLL
jgi:hypothetical protein